MKQIKLEGKGLRKVSALTQEELATILGGLSSGGNEPDGIDTYSEDCSGGTTTDTYETSCNNDTDNVAAPIGGVIAQPGTPVSTNPGTIGAPAQPGPIAAPIGRIG